MMNQEQQGGFNPFESQAEIEINPDPEERNLIRPTDQEENTAQFERDHSYKIFLCIKILNSQNSSARKFINYYLLTEIFYAIFMIVITFLSLFDKFSRKDFIPGLIFQAIPTYYSYVAYSSFNGMEDHYLKKFQKVDCAGLLTFIFNIVKSFVFFGGLVFSGLMLIGGRAFGQKMETEMRRNGTKWGEIKSFRKPSVEISAFLFCFVFFFFSVGQMRMYYKLRDFRLVYLLRMDRIRNN